MKLLMRITALACKRIRYALHVVNPNEEFCFGRNLFLLNKLKHFLFFSSSIEARDLPAYF